tara:strand:+ start:8801 stop:9142 length:342 start_codon:yes stop_codon:yes gene_type:complete
MMHGKIWGSTSPILVTPLIEVHKIFVLPGGFCSKHKHEHKWNAFFVLDGHLEIWVNKTAYNLSDCTSLSDGHFTTVAPGEFHWFKAETEVNALEIYYLGPITEDIIRTNVGGI